MDTKSTETLELPKILERLAAHCAFSASRELALTLEPVADLDRVRSRLELTTEAKRLRSSASNVTVGGARDVRAQAEQASKGAILQPLELLEIREPAA